MFEKTWIGVTGQRWKMYIMFALLALTMGLLVWAIFFGDRLDPSFGAWIIVMFLCVAVIFFLWLCFAIGCPFCGCRVIWTILRRLPHQESIYVAFFFLTHCPKCKCSFFERSSLANGHGPNA